MNDFQRVRDNVQTMIDKGADPERIRQYLYDEGMTPTKFKARLEGLKDAERVDSIIRYSIGSGVANLFDLPGKTMVAAKNLLGAGAGVAGHKAGVLNTEQLPEVTDPEQLSGWNTLFRKAGIINDDYAPTDATGRVLDFITQSFTGGGINPAKVARNLQQGLVKPVVRDVAAAGMSGLGAGVANNLTRDVNTGNESLDNLIKAGSTMAGGFAAGALPATRGTAGDRVSVATKGITPDQWKQADVRARLAAQKGSPITGYEALQAETGLNPKMQTQQRLAEQSDRAAVKGGLTSLMQNRPSANRKMVDEAFNTIYGAETAPDTLAGLFQKAAMSAIDEARSARTAAVRPNYQAARDNTAEAMSLIDESKGLEKKITAGQKWKNDAVQQAGRWYANSHEMINKAQNIADRKNLGWAGNKSIEKFNDKAEEYKGATIDAVNAAKERQKYIDDWYSELNSKQDALAEKNLPYIQNKVGSFLGALDKEIKIANPNTTEGKILQSFRDEIAPNGEMIYYPSQLESIYKANRDKLDLPFQPSPFDKTQAGVLGGHVKKLDALIREVSPEIAAGRQKYQELTRSMVEPLELGQVGKLARTDDFKQQSETFLPKDPADVTPGVVENTSRTISAQDPDIVKRFLAQDLRRRYEAAARDTLSGELPTAGARFAKDVAGNNVQESNLMSAVQASGADPQPFRGALDIFRAQGYKPPVNSATFANADEAAKVGGVLSMLTRPFKAFPDVVDNWRNGMALGDIHDALAAGPESVSRLEQLARANGVFDPVKQQLFISAVLANKPPEY